MSTLSQHYYRACRKKNWSSQEDQPFDQQEIEDQFLQVSGKSSLYPNMGFRDKRTGVWRRLPDVTTYKVGNEQWVKGRNSGPEYEKQGVSINDYSGKFGYEDSFYFRLPKGTDLSDDLSIQQSGAPDHFVIQCKNNMRMSDFKARLGILAWEAIAEAVRQTYPHLSSPEVSQYAND